MPFLEQLLFAFFIVWVRYASIHRADLDTLWRLMIANALGALIRTNYIDCIPLRYGLILALRFAGSTTYTIFRNFVRRLAASFHD